MPDEGRESVLLSYNTSLIGYGLVKWGFYLDRNIFHWYFHKGNYKIAFLWVIIIIRQRRTFLIRGTIVFNTDKRKNNEWRRIFQHFIIASDIVYLVIKDRIMTLTSSSQLFVEVIKKYSNISWEAKSYSKPFKIPFIGTIPTPITIIVQQQMYF